MVNLLDPEVSFPLGATPVEVYPTILPSILQSASEGTNISFELL